MKKLILALSLAAPLFAIPAQGQDATGSFSINESVVSPQFPAPRLVSPREFTSRIGQPSRSIGDGLSARDRQDLDLLRTR
jgi:hypothetical protein